MAQPVKVLATKPDSLHLIRVTSCGGRRELTIAIPHHAHTHTHTQSLKRKIFKKVAWVSEEGNGRGPKLTKSMTEKQLGEILGKQWKWER